MWGLEPLCEGLSSADGTSADNGTADDETSNGTSADNGAASDETSSGAAAGRHTTSNNSRGDGTTGCNSRRNAASAGTAMWSGSATGGRDDARRNGGSRKYSGSGDRKFN